MSMLHLLQSGLLLHIIGITVFGGAMFMGYWVQRQFSQEYAQDKNGGLVVVQTALRLGKLAALGVGIQVISGIMMIAATGGGFGQQLWFKIKLLLVVVIVALHFILTRRMQKRLKQQVLQDPVQHNATNSIQRLARRICSLQFLLLFCVVIIFVLSVFRFS